MASEGDMSNLVRKLVLTDLPGSGLEADAQAVVAAAFEGGARLHEVLSTLPGTAAPDADDHETEIASPAGRAYLTRVSLSGFRGVAGRLDVELQPAPGLVLVTGRNGSGKSSIAEAAELALCGRSERSSSRLGSAGLINLHHRGLVEVEIAIRIDGEADIRVGQNRGCYAATSRTTSLFTGGKMQSPVTAPFLLTVSWLHSPLPNRAKYMTRLTISSGSIHSQMPIGY